MRPSRISRAATNRAVLLAIAKHSPCAGRIIAVLTPITSPRVVTNGPPELPGLSAASVWMTSSMSRPERDRSDHRLRVRVEQLIVVRLGAFALRDHVSIVRTRSGRAHYPDGQV